MKQLPLKYKERMKVLLGEEYESYESSLNEEPIKAFRVNTDKIDLEDFEKINVFGGEKISYAKNGFYLNYDKVGNHPYHHAGMIYVQEPGAMAPAECIDIDPNWKILDMCAAPGGKSTQLKNKLGENGILVSNEIIPSRCKILTGNIERLGLKNTVTTCMDTNKLASAFPKTFDLIMVDAPCSGEGMFRKEEIAISEWNEENVVMCAKRQREILENAKKCLKDGGYIIYATCTFSLEENEMTIDSFLNNNPDFEIVPVKKEVKESTSDGIFFDGCKTENISCARRFYPHKNRGEGQFMAVLKSKSESGFSLNKKSMIKEKISPVVTEFLKDVLTDFDESQITMNGNTPVIFNPDFEIKKATVFSKGATIGEIRKNYIQPHHQFFMAMGKDFKRKINLTANSEEVKKYLHGEEFETNCENGWAAVLVDGCTLGGVKVVSGRAKNHYPKGLRTK